MTRYMSEYLQCTAVRKCIGNMRAKTSYEKDNIDYYANQTLNILNTQFSTEQHVGHFLVWSEH